MKVKAVILPASLAVNVLFAAFLVLALLSDTSSVSFGGGRGGVTAATIATIPEGPDASLSFSSFGITLRKGESAVLQFSLVVGGRQANWIVPALYDRAVISVSPTDFGVRVTALAPGETVMQAVTPEGIREVARITVTE